uniref:Uncharacterized protein n=1 Tax=Arundo donax TaxID=35708 RepID=A0A0A9H5N9_ARUDO
MLYQSASRIWLFYVLNMYNVQFYLSFLLAGQGEVAWVANYLVPCIATSFLSFVCDHLPCKGNNHIDGAQVDRMSAANY